MTVYSKHLSIQCNLPGQIKQVQDNYISVIPESSESSIIKGVIGGLAGVTVVLIIIIVGLLYSRKSGKLLYTGCCNQSSCSLTSEMSSHILTLTNGD